MVSSWYRKVERAEHHLRDLKGLIAPYGGRDTYSVSEGFEPDDDVPYVHRLDIPEPDDPLLPIIVGDLMFNLRSALDHIAVAMVPESKRTQKTAFPIFVDDIDAKDAAGKYLHPKARKRWRTITKGFPKGAMPIVERAQPYMHQREGRNPHWAVAEILRSLQNADKHSQLMFVVSGLKDFTIWMNVSDARKVRLRLPRVPSDHMIAPRTVVAREAEPLPPHMHVEAEGTVQISMGNGEDGAYYSCPDVFEDMRRDVDGLLDALDEYAIHVPRPPRRKSVS